MYTGKSVVQHPDVRYNLPSARIGHESKKSMEKGKDMPAQVGDTAPDFTLPSVSEGDITLSSYKGGKHVVLSFHVFDFTSG